MPAFPYSNRSGIPSTSVATTAHPASRDVALERRRVRRTPQAGFVVAVDAIASDFLGNTDDIAKKRCGEQYYTVNKLVIIGFSK
jgi:hypothetical protein